MAYVIAKTALSIALWGVAVIGWLGHRLGWPVRGLAMVAAFTLVASLPLTDELGFALAASCFGAIWLGGRRARAA